MRFSNEVLARLTFSKIDLFLACAGAFHQDAPRGPAGEPARFGSAFHELMATGADNDVDVAGKWGVQDRAAELHGRVERARACLANWLDRGNPWQLDLTTRPREYELSVALKINGFARRCEPVREADHVYPDRREGELCGTLDLVLGRPRDARGRRHPMPKTKTDAPGRRAQLSDVVFVLDHKSGAFGSFIEPAELGQLLLGAAAMMRLEDAPRAVVGILHAPDDGPPHIYVSHVLDYDDIGKFLERVNRATNVPRGYVRPGAHCDGLYCPHKATCSAHEGTAAALVQLGRAPLNTNERAHVDLSTSEGIARAWAGLRQLDQLGDLLRPRLLEAVEAQGGSVELPEDLRRFAGGKSVLGITEREGYEQVMGRSSMATAIGKAEAEKFWEAAKKKGVVKMTKGSRFVQAKDDR